MPEDTPRRGVTGRVINLPVCVLGPEQCVCWVEIPLEKTAHIQSLSHLSSPRFLQNSLTHLSWIILCVLYTISSHSLIKSTCFAGSDILIYSLDKACFFGFFIFSIIFTYRSFDSFPVLLFSLLCFWEIPLLQSDLTLFSQHESKYLFVVHSLHCLWPGNSWELEVFVSFFQICYILRTVFQ